MLTKQSLHTLLDLDVPSSFSSVLIYAEKESARLDYVCGFIFNKVLKIHYKITTDEQYFGNSSDIKINYSNKVIEKSLRIVPHALLFEKGISEIRPLAAVKEGMIYFYETTDNKDLSYDIFSAVFYFISRYEEWQSFEHDQHQRFEAKASLLFKNNFHLKPVVDVWITELAAVLKKTYPAILIPEKKFKVISTIDVDNLYAYKYKGVLRTMGAGIKDILKADFKNLSERIKVLSGKKEDPFDIYSSVSDFCFENRIPLIYFFLFRTGTKHDRTVDPKSAAYPEVFKRLKQNHVLMGLHPSYETSVRKELLKQELDAFTEKTQDKINLTRQHYLRFNIRSTPLELMENGIEADFTMGFASLPGFRAGTSHPFSYYNFNSEKSETLLFVPFCVMDGAYIIYKSSSPEMAYEEMMSLAREVRKVNGIFISVFHERSFSDHLYPGYGAMFMKFHSALTKL